MSTLFHERFYPSDPIPSIRRGCRLPWPGGRKPEGCYGAGHPPYPPAFLFPQLLLAAPSRRGWKRLSKVTRNWVVHGLLPSPIAANDKFRDARGAAWTSFAAAAEFPAAACSTKCFRHYIYIAFSDKKERRDYIMSPVKDEY